MTAGRPLPLRSDEELVASFRRGSDRAFNLLHERHGPRVLAYVRHTLPRTAGDVAEDVTQDVFLRAYRALRDDCRAIRVRPWLLRIAHNRCMDQLRRPVESLAPPAEPAADVHVDVERRRQVAGLVEAIGRLPERQRSALVLRALGGLSYEDIAAELRVTLPAVKSLLVRARANLALTVS